MNQDTANQYDQPPSKKNYTWIYLVIILLLLGTNIFLFTQKNRVDKQVVLVREQKNEADSAKASLQTEYNASLARLDDLTGKNSQLDNQLRSANSELSKAKARIEEILKKQNASQKEIAEAKGLISRLNTKISGYEKEISRLKQENTSLTFQRDSVVTTNRGLTESNEGLQKKINLAKVLHASNIRIIPVNLSRGGRKEKETTKAKRVDVVRILFDIDENRVAESGSKQLNIRILNPDGELLSNAALGSGSFHLAEGGKQTFYSLSKEIPLETGQPMKDIKVDWKQSAQYEKGNYNVEIYHEGYLIGKGTALLK